MPRSTIWPALVGTATFSPFSVMLAIPVRTVRPTLVVSAAFVRSTREVMPSMTRPMLGMFSEPILVETDAGVEVERGVARA